MPVPAEGAAWRISMVAGKPLSKWETLVNGTARRLKFNAPFGRDVHVHSEQIRRPVSPQAGAGTGQQNGGLENPISGAAGARRSP